MKKTAIVYYSEHHGNTLKLLEAIKERNEDITLIDASKHRELSLLSYDRVGFASGIYYSGFAKQLLSFAQINLMEKHEVFFIYTCGMYRDNYESEIRKLCESKRCRILGSYHCAGFDTFGPLKLIGGIQKNHPNEQEVQDAVAFYAKLPE